jgi:hypothetical protein
MTYVKRTCGACKRGVDGPDGRRQAHREVFTASSGASCVSPKLKGGFANWQIRLLN